MTILVEGRDGSGHRTRALWSLVAERGDGPVIPVLPAVTLLRQWFAGPGPEPGARAAAGLVTLAAMEEAFAPFAISTRVTSQHLGTGTLLERALGHDARSLPETLRAVHARQPRVALGGEAVIEGAAHPLGRLVAACFGFPRSGRRQPS